MMMKERRWWNLPAVPWRDIMARLPLPMLALSASYGVYSFARLYVPDPVAIIQAAAFELTYIGLAVTRGLTRDQRKRATAISVGAVVVSILYNSLAGLFHRQPDILTSLGSWGEVLLAILHGAPLAWVAYLVADLLLHSQNADEESENAGQQPVESPVDYLSLLDRKLDAGLAELAGFTEREISAQLDARLGPVRPEPVTLNDLVDFNQLPEPAQLRPVAPEPAAAVGNNNSSSSGRGQQVREMRAAGRTWNDIAAHFGVSQRTVINWSKE